jgi:hypothetical protein
MNASHRFEYRSVAGNVAEDDGREENDGNRSCHHGQRMASCREPGGQATTTVGDSGEIHDSLIERGGVTHKHQLR